jgi:hypothetical protein
MRNLRWHEGFEWDVAGTEGRTLFTFGGAMFVTDLHYSERLVATPETCRERFTEPTASPWSCGVLSIPRVQDAERLAPRLARRWMFVGPRPPVSFRVCTGVVNEAA